MCQCKLDGAGRVATRAADEATVVSRWYTSDAPGGTRIGKTNEVEGFDPLWWRIV